MEAARAKVAVQKAAFEKLLVSGAAFHPSPEELAGQRDLSKRIDVLVPWVAYQDDMAASEWPDLETVLQELDRGERQQVYLGRANEMHLILELNDTWGVVTISSGSEFIGEAVYLYAYGVENVREQIPEADQLVLGCPCCGVGMGWHPSRAHMPADVAREVFLAGVQHDYAKTEWLRYDPSTFVGPGRG